MIHAFKKYFYSLLYQPGISLLLIGLICYLLSLVTPAKLLLIPGLIILAFACLWVYSLGRRRISPNFILIRTVPFLEGRPRWMIFEDPTKDICKRDCREILSSLREDLHLVEDLAPGRYVTITHQTFLKVIRRSGRALLEREPKQLYSSTLQGVLKRQTGGRCKHCKSPCHSWKAAPRSFFLVEFTIESDVDWRSRK